jgi:hypothetical protein
VRDDVPNDNETFLVTDFVNLKIKSVQSFGCAHRDKMCVYIFIGVSDYTYMSIYIYTVHASVWELKMRVPSPTARSLVFGAVDGYSVCACTVRNHNVSTTMKWNVFAAIFMAGYSDTGRD